MTSMHSTGVRNEVIAVRAQAQTDMMTDESHEAFFHISRQASPFPSCILQIYFVYCSENGRTISQTPYLRTEQATLTSLTWLKSDWLECLSRDHT